MKAFKLFAAVAAVLTVSCAKELTPVEKETQGVTMIQASLSADAEESSKTSLDANGVSIVWYESDDITVASPSTGNQKFIVSELSENGHQATFQGLTSKEGPWYAVFPYNDGISYAAEGPKGVKIPRGQAAVEGTFGPKANAAVAFTPNIQDNITFVNLSSFISFTVNESGIKRITLTSENTLSGTANVNWNGGDPSLTFTETEKSVVLAGDFVSGKKYYVCVAPGTLKNPSFKFEKQGYYAVLNSTGTKELERNGNYYLGAFSVPAAKWVEAKGISTPDDLQEFAFLVNAGSSYAKFQGEDGSVKLLNNIDMAGKSWTPIGTLTTTTSLAYNTSAVPSTNCVDIVFDGDGYTISNLTMSVDIQSTQVCGLFGATKGGEIKNLNLDKAKLTFTGSGIHASNAAIGALVGYAYGTKLTNIYVNSSVSGAATSSKDRSVGIGGICGMLNGTNVTVKDCIFDGSLTPDIGSKYTSTSTAVAAGIVAIVPSPATAIVVDHCTNNAKINSKTHRTAGIVGNAFCQVLNCTNNGDITSNFSTKKASSTTVTGVRTGGIIGICTTQGKNTYCVENCTNNGNISTGEADSGIGGIAGLTRSFTITGCTNKGNVYGPAPGRGLLVGIVSTANSGYKTTFSDCSVKGETGTGEGAADVVEANADNYLSISASFLSGADQSTFTKDNIKYIGSAPLTGPGISTAADLQAFADAVNSGSSVAKWQDGDFIVNILNDIDCSSLNGWNPIGNPEHPYTGHFCGNGFTISNLTMVFTNSDEQTAYGLFGNVESGAIIESFQLGLSCSATMKPTAPVYFGAVVGRATDAVVRGITNYAPVTLKESTITATSTLSAIGGIAGAITTSSSSVIISNLVNHGEVNVTENANTGSGSTSVYVGGIVGRAMASKEAVRLYFRTCVNNGNVNATCCRVGGIGCAPAKYTTIESCINYGNVFNKHNISGAGRPAGILCTLDDGGKLIKCINYGDVISASSDRVGGLCCNTSSSTGTKIQDCDNYGRVITDSDYRGTLFGYCHGATPISSCVAQGDVGTYNNGNYQMVGVNSENYFSYSGKYTSAATYATTENIVWDRQHTPASDTFGPDKTSISFTALAESASNVKMSSKTEDWTVAADQTWIHITDEEGAAVTSGTASSYVVALKIKADVNTGAARSGKVTFTSASATASITVSQAASATSFPSDWMFSNDSFSANWVDNGIIPATNGNAGYIKVFRGSASSPDFVRTVSDNRPVISNIIKGDYILYSVPVANLPANSYISFATQFIPTKSSNAHKYFICEILDGDTWKANDAQLRTATEDSNIKYSFKLYYGNGQYGFVYDIFKLSNAITDGEVKIRLRAVGDYTAGGKIESINNTNAEIAFGKAEHNGGHVNNLGTGAPTTVKKVLMLGNSFTYYFVPPIKLMELAFSQGKQLNVNAHLKGSQTFELHCGLEQSTEAINAGGYDYAFLQDQSQNPSNYGMDPVTNADVRTWANTITNKVRAKSPDCKAILEATWAFPKNNYGGYGSYAAFDNYMMTGCKDIATYCSTWISPIGAAFAKVRSQYPAYTILHTDSKHQSNIGAYVKSCVNYLVLFGEKFNDNASDCGLDPTMAANIRKICEDVVIGHESEYYIVR